MSFWASFLRTAPRNDLPTTSPPPLLRSHVLQAASLLLWLCFVSGCLPTSQTQLDEEREPHFLEGKSRLNARDDKGAFEAFEKALQVNPHSASAHFELAVLCQQNKQDYAGAIYHFDRYIELRPRSGYSDIVTQHILACKQELARTVSLGPVTQSMQHDLEQLTDENKRLHEDLDACRANLAGLQQSRSNPPAAAVIASRPSQISNSRPSPVQSSNLAAAARPSATATTSVRTHTVKPGDTPTMIARKYGVKLDALMAANPSLDPRRLQIGQVLNVPGQ